MAHRPPEQIAIPNTVRKLFSPPGETIRGLLTDDSCAQSSRCKQRHPSEEELVQQARKIYPAGRLELLLPSFLRHFSGCWLPLGNCKLFDRTAEIPHSAF